MSKNDKSGMIHSRTIFTGDSLYVLRGIRSESIDLIYLDPPFNSDENYSAPIGSEAAGAEFKDMWRLEDVDVEWWGEINEDYPGLYKVLDATKTIHGEDMMAYCIYMAIRLIELHRVLKPTGYLYLHCDPTASHYLKLCMDEIFGESNFRNEIVWIRNSGRTKIKHQDGYVRSWGNQQDIIFLYGKSSDTPNLDLPYMKDDKVFRYKEPDGRKFALSPIVLSASMGRRPNQEYEYKDHTPKYGWRYILPSLKEIDKRGLIHWNKNGNPYKKMYEEDHKGKVISNIWDDIDAVRGKEKIGYPTQKPLALLKRIIEASSKKDDVVLDPFCGCATACLAAEYLDRKWIGIDISPKAAELVKARMINAATMIDKKGEKHDIMDKFTKGAGKIITRVDIPRQHPQKSPCLKNKLYGEQEGNCVGCLNHFEIRQMEEDHKIPQAHGGQSFDSNFQLLCSSCNRLKGTGTMEELRVKLRDMKILKD